MSKPPSCPETEAFLKKCKDGSRPDGKHSTAIDKEILDRARAAWEHRNRFSGRAFTTTLMHKFWNPQPPDKFSGLRLVAYQEKDWSKDTKRFLGEKARLHYSDEELAELNGDAPFYEWPRPHPRWNPGAGTVLMDYSCKRKRGRFIFNGFWSVRDCPPVTLANSRLTLLTKLPHFNGYSISAKEKTEIAEAIKRFVASRDFRVDNFDFHIDMDFLGFCRSESTLLKRRLVEQAVETAKDLCRAGQFDRALTLNTIRHCMEDRTWLNDYAEYVGGSIYERGNPRKKGINLELGRRIRAGIGATIQTDHNGKTGQGEGGRRNYSKLYATDGLPCCGCHRTLAAGSSQSAARPVPRSSRYTCFPQRLSGKHDATQQAIRDRPQNLPLRFPHHAAFLIRLSTVSGNTDRLPLPQTSGTLHGAPCWRQGPSCLAQQYRMPRPYALPQRVFSAPGAVSSRQRIDPEFAVCLAHPQAPSLQPADGPWSNL